MIEVEITQWHSPDVEIDDPDVEANPEVIFLLELALVERGHATMDLFSVVVATPEGLRSHATRYPGRDPLLCGRGIVMSSFSWALLRQEIHRIIDVCRSDTWEGTVPKLQRYFSWEYEDYIMKRND